MPDFLDEARRWADAGIRIVRGAVSPKFEYQQPTAIELWKKTSPQLERALTLYDQKNSGSLPDTAWFGASKTKCQQELDEIVDAVIAVLEHSGAVECGIRIRAFQKAIAGCQERIGRYREELLSARPQASLSVPQSVWTKSAEDLEAAIADESRSIQQTWHQIAGLRGEFRNQLHLIGIDVSSEEVDSLLLPVQNNIVSMAATITHIASLTAQLERLVDETRELPSHTRRYYGIYVLLVYSIDRIQIHFIEQIDQTYVPKLRIFEQQARENIADAQRQLSRGGPKDLLRANIEAGKTAIRACEFLADALRSQRNAVAAEEIHTNRMLAAAANTYNTVRLSLNVAELLSDCQAAFRALRNLQVPRLRPFQNLELKDELQRLLERLLAEEE